MINELDNLIVRILKDCPPIANNSSESMQAWIAEIKNRFSVDIRQHTILTERLMWIWLSQCKGITLPNLELDSYAKL